MKKFFVSFILFTLLISGVFAADASTVGDWWGKVTIDGVENDNGAVVDAYVGGIKVSSATVGELTSKYYLIHVEGATGDNILFKVNGIDAATVSWTNEDHELNLSVSSPTTPSNGGGSSGGGGGGSVVKNAVNCFENWQCGDWSNCTNAEQTRTCTDLSNCNTIVNRPAVTQSCGINSTAENQTAFSSFLTGSVVNGTIDFAKSPTGIAVGVLILIAGSFAFFRLRKK